jgi:hypothetical protein
MGQIFEELKRRKKGSEPKGSDPNSLIGSGGRMAFAANAAQLVLAPLPMLRIGAPAAEPTPS